jgi:hypothetical protein
MLVSVFLAETAASGKILVPKYWGVVKKIFPARNSCHASNFCSREIGTRLA